MILPKILRIIIFLKNNYEIQGMLVFFFDSLNVAKVSKRYQNDNSMWLFQTFLLEIAYAKTEDFFINNFENTYLKDSPKVP